MKTHLFIKDVTARMCFLLSFLFLTTVSLTAQECACKQGVNVSVGGNGSATVTASMMLASNNTCGGTHTVAVMKTPNGLPINGSPNVNCSHVGQTLYAKVTNGTNSCWGTINVMDELAPVITPPMGIITLSCVEMNNFTPTVIENCTLDRMDTVTNAITVNNCNGQLPTNVLKRIVRTYRAIDKSGNVSADVVFTFDVTIIDNLNDIDLPESLTKMNGNALECDGNWAKIPAGKPNAGNPSPIDIGDKFGTGVPTFNGADLYPEADGHCNLTVGFTDVVLSNHNCVTKIIRKWEIFEWSCANRTFDSYSQMIEITDTKLPQFVPLNDMTVSTSNHACEASLTLPKADVSDNCTAKNLIKIDVIYPGGINENTNGGQVKLPVGNHVITYRAYDWCGNSSEASMTVSVKDHTPPVSICDEFTTVALSDESVAHVPAFVFDDGSYDKCSDIKMLVRRMGSVQCAPCDIPEFPGFHYMGEYGSGSSKKYYYLSKHTATPDVAFKMAKAMGGNVVTIDSPGLDSWLWTRFLALVPSSGPDWIDMIIGLNDIDGDKKYTWQSGSTSTYRNFSASPVTSPYVVKYHDQAGLWFGYDPQYLAKYVVEITDPCSWSNYAHFCCQDINNDPMVAFRVIDEAGNFNDCMVSVRVQDKIGPSITCPDHITINCDQPFNNSDLSDANNQLFGWPTATDNCDVLDIILTNTTENYNACRIGSIRRDFEVTDQGGRKATCFQTISLTPVAPFTEAGIKWPADFMNLEGCANPALPAFSPDVLGRPVFADGFCALVAADYEDKVFSFNNPAGDACFKILRTWTVIDWCQPYQTNGGISYKTWTKTQTIAVSDKVKPTIAPFTVEHPFSTLNNSCDEGYIILEANATDNCTDVLAWSYKIDALNDGSFEPGLQKSGHGNKIVASGIYPMGVHKIVYSFEDKCGNLSTREQLFTIVNDKDPSPICHFGLATDLVAMVIDGDTVGMSTVQIGKFDKGSYHVCNAYDLIFSFEEIYLINGVPVTVDSRTFSCEDVGRQEVTMYVGVLTPLGTLNQTYCTTFIDVQDNGQICEGRFLLVGNVSGRISTQNDESVADVAVSLGGSELSYQTKDNGMFVFPNLVMGRNYQVSPVKNDDILNGVSTLDLVLIQRHILEMEALSTPFNMIAADINKDKQINTLDLVELRKVILGTHEQFPNNTSWRFMDRKFKFIDPSQAHQENFTENHEISGLNKEMIVDFVGIKIGDVNESVVSNIFDRNRTESRSTVTLSTKQQSFQKNQTIQVPVYLQDMQNIAGAQFTMSFDETKLELSDIIHGMTSDENIGMTRLSEGLLTFSWNESEGVYISEGQALLTLVFTTKSGGLISEAFEINSSLVNAELYDSQLKTKSVQWKVATEEGLFRVHQNIPNPFSQTTTVAFELPEAGEVSCTIRDISGKLVKEVRQYFEAGTQSLSIHKSELPHAGVYIYTVQSGRYKETKMMVVIE